MRKFFLFASFALMGSLFTMAQDFAPLKAAADNGPAKEAPQGDVRHYSRCSYGVYLYYGWPAESFDDGYASEVVFADDGKVYLKNPNCYISTGGYLEGTQEGDEITFQLPQCVGTAIDAVSGETLDIYARMLDVDFDVMEWTEPEDQTFVMKIREDGSLVADYEPYLMLCLTFDDGEWTGYGDFNVIYTPFNDELLEAPSGLTTEDCAFKYEGVGHFGKIGFQGNDVYLQGLFDGTPDSWVKGYIDGDSLRIPSGQYMGIYQSHYTYLISAAAEEVWDDIWEDWVIYVVATEAIDMKYDAEARSAVTEDEFFIFNGGNDGNFYYLGYMMHPAIQCQDKAPAAPANPVVLDFFEVQEDWPGGIAFDMTQYDINGNLLHADQLYYRIYDQNCEVYTFYPDPYPIDEAMNLIPYYFQAEYDFYPYMSEHQVLLYDYELFSKAGVQAVYLTDTKELVSDIIFSDGTVVSASSKVASLPTEGVATTEYYDMQGHRIIAPKTGELFILVNRDSEGRIIESSKMMFR